MFLLVAGKANRPVGAELRGTGSRVWRGMAPGTRKDLGFFWIGVPGSPQIVLCESAIDVSGCHWMRLVSVVKDGGGNCHIWGDARLIAAVTCLGDLQPAAVRVGWGELLVLPVLTT